MGRWHRLLVATLAAVGFYSSWSVIEQNISAFADGNTTASFALQMMADHMECVELFLFCMTSSDVPFERVSEE